MMSIADDLPPDIASQIHPAWRKNEADYWAVRDQLLSQYADEWIGFADGQVIEHGSSPVAVLHNAQATGRHPFVICVGREDEPCRIRRATFSHDSSYRGEPLPVNKVEFRGAANVAGLVLDRVTPDTGADGSVLPWKDCQALALQPSQGVPGLMSGVAGGASATISFRVWAHLEGKDYPCRLQADFQGKERIVGRDVLNRLVVVFDGPTGEVIVNP